MLHKKSFAPFSITPTNNRRGDFNCVPIKVRFLNLEIASKIISTDKTMGGSDYVFIHNSGNTLYIFWGNLGLEVKTLLL